MNKPPSPQMSPSGGEESIIGTTVGGRFRIEKRLAAGGMGVVYKAEQVPLGRAVAVKVLKQPPNPTLDDSFSKRFLLEAAAVANLQHPNTIVVHDYGRDGDLLYFAMEYLEGKTLSEHVKANGPLHPADAIHVGLQVAKSLQDAHTQGLVHRDLKPGNVMLTHRGGDPLFVKVLDFGLVKMVSRQEGDDSARLTQSGIMLGSPRYMAPEQVRGSDVDHRADIYAFGAMLCFMLTGQPPFPAGSQFEAMRAHVYQQAPKLRQLFADCRACEGLERIVLKCLEKKPDDRFSWLAEIVDELNQAARIPEAQVQQAMGGDAKATALSGPGRGAPANAAEAQPAAAPANAAEAQPAAASSEASAEAPAEAAVRDSAAPGIVPQTAMRLDAEAMEARSHAASHAADPVQTPGSRSSVPGSFVAAPGSFVAAPATNGAAASSSSTWALRIGLLLIFLTGAAVAAVVLPPDRAGTSGAADGGGSVEGPGADDSAARADMPTPTGVTAAPADDPHRSASSPADALPRSEERAPALHLTRIVSEPASARVTRQGADLGDAPLSVRIPEGESWTLVVSADGFEDQELTLVGGAQSEVQVRLERSRRNAPRNTPDGEARSTVTSMEPSRVAPAPTVGGTPIRDPWN